MKENSLSENFRLYNLRHNLFTKQDKILLTVSGGVDSMVMLHLFIDNGYNIGVAHCNFGLRGAESDEDELTVQNECAKYGVPCHNRRFDTIGEIERSGDSMEMVARRLRYEWFYSLCQDEGYNVISVAHHTDDSIETFFINLLRGTGLKGLTGISMHLGRVIRPLLFATRKDILEYAVANHIPFREDSSNRSTKYLRNKIRLGLLPVIREINPKFTALMRGNLYRLGDAQTFIETAIAKIKAQICSSKDGIDTIDISKIDPDFEKEFIIYEILKGEYGFKGEVVEELYKSLNYGSGKRFYSKDFVASTSRGTIVVSKIVEGDECEVSVSDIALRSYCGNSVLYYERTDVDNINDYNQPTDVALLDFDKLKYPLTLRHWREGDSFVPFGMNGTKKVSDFLIDCKVPLLEKSRQFVLTSGEEIVWVVGRRIDNRYKITSTTEKVLKITRENI